MIVSKTISIEFEDLKKIDSLIKDGEARNLSEFIRCAIKNQLKEDENSG